jgi:hypothetical protein
MLTTKPPKRIAISLSIRAQAARPDRPAAKGELSFEFRERRGEACLGLVSLACSRAAGDQRFPFPGVGRWHVDV